VCALAAGKAINETAKVKARSKAIKAFLDLFIEIFKYFSFSFLFCGELFFQN
jgi:hypothetical protein